MRAPVRSVIVGPRGGSERKKKLLHNCLRVMSMETSEGEEAEEVRMSNASWTSIDIIGPLWGDRSRSAAPGHSLV